jgi:ElaB/YqjD/DUF883 family membrane-anchored ribosome-binding protein
VVNLEGNYPRAVHDKKAIHKMTDPFTNPLDELTDYQKEVLASLSKSGEQDVDALREKYREIATRSNYLYGKHVDKYDNKITRVYIPDVSVFNMIRYHGEDLIDGQPIGRDHRGTIFYRKGISTQFSCYYPQFETAAQCVTVGPIKVRYIANTITGISCSDEIFAKLPLDIGDVLTPLPQLTPYATLACEGKIVIACLLALHDDLNNFTVKK